MLKTLSIKNFAIIDDIQISFDDGFSVLTGETGAGKSIIIEAVNLLLGSRASADLVRSGCDQAELEAFFDIDETAECARILQDQGADPAEGLIIRRLVQASGKSHVFVNSKRSTLDLLRQVTWNLAGVSSQHAHQGLLKTENHLEILDEFAGTLDLKQEVSDVYHAVLPLKKKHARLSLQLEQNRKEQDLLEFQMQEIEAAALVENEEAHLEKQRKTLVNAAQIFEAINGGVYEINDRDGALIERLSMLRNTLEKFDSSDDRLDKVAQQMSAVVFELQDIAEELRLIASDIDLDPASLDATDQRLDLIAKLKRKYGPTLEAVFDTHAQIQKMLAQTSDIEAEIADCEKQMATLSEQIRQKAGQLSALRKAAAQTLSTAAAQELASLEMGKARFSVDFSFYPPQKPEDIQSAEGYKIGPDGMDKIGFLLSPNPGETLKPLNKIASGGELSRIVLALKAVLSQKQSLETLIFDEVDAGIGGATSEKVGLKLRQLSQKHQVICITHLAQIAKYGSGHFRIKKQVVDGRTCTSIVPLTCRDERVREIARMIGGSAITPATLAHAGELLDQTAS